MRFIDLFAGIGGFRRGMELAGHTCVGFCEWDKFAAASYISMHLITEEQRRKLRDLPLKQRQAEILKEEYRNGEWYSTDVRLIRGNDIPRAECWCFGAPCQDFSVAGQRAGLGGGRSSLVREVFRVLNEIEEENRPEWLVYENVKGMLSSNKGLDFLAIILELDELGYDVEWEIFNTKNFGVPQNRERVYTIGHLRSRGQRKVFPLKGAGGEDSICEVKQIGQRNRPGRDNLNQYRVYDQTGIAPCLNKMDGGGREPHIPVMFGIDYNYGGKERDVSNTIISRYDDGVTKRTQDGTAVAIPVITPDRIEKRQNGRRLKENGDPSYTLTAQDHHGVAISINEKLTVYAVWYEKYNCYIAIRKLTPKECFRLQGWTDDYFEKAEFVNSDSQLYKQAGNGVTVDVVEEIGKAIREEEQEVNDHELICKGRREDNYKAVEGYYLKLTGGEKPLHIIVDTNGEYHRIDPASLRRFTGFTDQDGERLFEGDVVNYGGKETMSVIKWDRGMWIIEDSDWEFLYLAHSQSKLIGEIKNDD